MITKLNHISFEIIGSSHAKNITLKIKGIKKGTRISLDEIKNELKRRNPGTFYNTQRKEEDNFNIVKGIKNNKVVSNIVVLFENNHVNKNSYKDHEGFLRPSHSDYAQYLKKGYIETGAGEYSGRMTLPLTFLGSIAKQELQEHGVIIKSKIERIENFKDVDLKESLEEYSKLNLNLPVCEEKKAENILHEIKEEKDTAGGILKTIVFNPIKGLGGELTKGLESKISNLLFAIPSIKGIEFGDGFKITEKKGSEVEDSFYLENNNIRTKTNHNGGILGGVSTGENIIVKTAFKPIPTHSKEMTSFNVNTLKEETVVFGGNHDVFSLNRAIPCVEGLIALVLLDELYEKN